MSLLWRLSLDVVEFPLAQNERHDFERLGFGNPIRLLDVDSHATAAADGESNPVFCVGKIEVDIGMIRQIRPAMRRKRDGEGLWRAADHIADNAAAEKASSDEQARSIA